MNSRRFHYQPPRQTPPAGACDSHLHVLGPTAQYPYARERTYTPPQATATDCQTMLNVLGMTRAILVQPSIYGDDNRCLLDALALLGGSARGVAVIPQSYPVDELQQLARAGVRAVRLNTLALARREPDLIMRQLNLSAALIAAHTHGWHLQIYADSDLLPLLEPWARSAPLPVVFDHFGGLPGAGFEHHPGWAALRRMLDSGNVWIKLSAAYRLPGGSAKTFTSARAICTALLRACPQRLLWGTDWPHTSAHGRARISDEIVTPFQTVNAGHWLDCVAEWAGDDALIQQILVENPNRLYGFDAPPMIS